MLNTVEMLRNFTEQIIGGFVSAVCLGPGIIRCCGEAQRSGGNFEYIFYKLSAVIISVLRYRDAPQRKCC